MKRCRFCDAVVQTTKKQCSECDGSLTLPHSIQLDVLIRPDLKQFQMSTFIFHWNFKGCLPKFPVQWRLEARLDKSVLWNEEVKLTPGSTFMTCFKYNPTVSGPQTLRIKITASNEISYQVFCYHAQYDLTIVPKTNLIDGHSLNLRNQKLVNTEVQNGEFEVTPFESPSQQLIECKPILNKKVSLRMVRLSLEGLEPGISLKIVNEEIAFGSDNNTYFRNVPQECQNLLPVNKAVKLLKDMAKVGAWGNISGKSKFRDFPPVQMGAFGIPWRQIPPGRHIFQCGDKKISEAICQNGLRIMVIPVTEHVMNSAFNRVGCSDTRLPVTNVGIEQAISLCTAIEKEQGFKPGQVRLPTASEWMYVALAGEKQSDYIQRKWQVMARVEAPGLSEVCNFLPNRWGIFDLFGNVEEWVIDGEAEEWESPSNRLRIVSKGGSFRSHWRELDAASEYPGAPPDCGAEWQGFRLVIVD